MWWIEMWFGVGWSDIMLCVLLVVCLIVCVGVWMCVGVCVCLICCVWCVCVVVLMNEEVEFMVENFKFWVMDEESVCKCDVYMCEKYVLLRVFNLEKVWVVLDLLKVDYVKLFEVVGLFSLSKTWFGMFLVLERCGDLLE